MADDTKAVITRLAGQRHPDVPKADHKQVDRHTRPLRHGTPHGDPPCLRRMFHANPASVSWNGNDLHKTPPKRPCPAYDQVIARSIQALDVCPTGDPLS